MTDAAAGTVDLAVRRWQKDFISAGRLTSQAQKRSSTHHWTAGALYHVAIASSIFSTAIWVRLRSKTSCSQDCKHQSFRLYAYLIHIFTSVFVCVCDGRTVLHHLFDMFETRHAGRFSVRSGHRHIWFVIPAWDKCYCSMLVINNFINLCLLFMVRRFVQIDSS